MDFAGFEILTFGEAVLRRLLCNLHKDSDVADDENDERDEKVDDSRVRQERLAVRRGLVAKRVLALDELVDGVVARVEHEEHGKRR